MISPFKKVLFIIFKFIVRTYNLIIITFVTLMYYCRSLGKIVLEKEWSSPKIDNILGKRMSSFSEKYRDSFIKIMAGIILLLFCKFGWSMLSHLLPIQNDTCFSLPLSIHPKRKVSDLFSSTPFSVIVIMLTIIGSWATSERWEKTESLIL